MKDYNYVNVFEMPRPHSARNLTTVQSIYTDMTKEPKYIYSNKFLNDRCSFVNEHKQKVVVVDWIAEQLLKDQSLESIVKIYSPRPYLVGHPAKVDDTLLRENDDREEEKVAHRLYEKETEELINSDIDFFADYQVPILRKKDSKKEKEDINYKKEQKPGKVDLVAVSDEKKEIYLLELKKHHTKKNQDESLLRCVCECYTYWKQICHKKLAKEISLSSEYPKPEQADYKVVPAVLVFAGQYQHKQFRSGYMQNVQKLMLKLSVKMFVIDCDMEFKSDESYKKYIKQCTIKELPVKVIKEVPTPHKGKSYDTSLALALDYAIRDAEIKNLIIDNAPLTYGYKINENTSFDNYLSKECFEEFKKHLSDKASVQYGKGGGSELKERKNKTKVVVAPPKMASFGSSSRMMYNTANSIIDIRSKFDYEKKLHTTVGGTANLDGYVETDKHHIFVEAKCREPYGVKDNKIKSAYYNLYHSINQENIALTCKITNLDGTPIIEQPNDEYMLVDFYFDKHKIEHFDIKQMLCHLLGIGTKILKENLYIDRDIKFIYLLYNPQKLDFADEDIKKTIINIRDKTCNESKVITKELFGVILKYLKDKRYSNSKVNIDDIVNNFSFIVCDQDNFKENCV